MIFGRNKGNDEADLEQVDEQLVDEVDDELEQDEVDVDEESDQAPAEDADQLPDELNPAAARWAELDEQQDWREDGPFDFDEVDLDADEIDRLDFGSLIMTPFDDMQLQLQIEEQTQQVNAALVMHANSALEVALFAAPAQSPMAPEVRTEMCEVTVQQGGNASLAEGPFGTEIRRVIPVQGPEGEELMHVSRTWFAQGPRWLLRGVLMGEAGMYDGSDGPAEVLLEFFRNLVVRRDASPRVPGDLITMQLPAELMAQSEPGAEPEA